MWRNSAISSRGTTERPESYHERETRNVYSRSSYQPWDASGSSRSTTGYRMRPIPSNIPVNFHEYHWRSSFENEATLSRTSTAVTTFSESVLGGSVMNFGNEDNGTIPRNWEHTGLGSVVHSGGRSDTGIGMGGVRFTLMSYNILAPGLVEKHQELYEGIDPLTLEWANRLNGLFGQIQKYAPDIVCLQEVEDAQFRLTFEPQFTSLGYRGIFKKKTGEKEDGCAIFYRTSKFLLIDKLEIEFLQPHVPLLNRDNVGLLLKLETRTMTKRQKLVVGTTHLLFNPRRQDVKLAQAQLLLAELDRFAFCGFDKGGNSMYHPILMTGDFNCKPFTSVPTLVANGQLQYLDEHGDLIKLLKRKGFDSVLPSHCGITDQCQHYKVALERYTRWKALRANNFELDLRSQERLVNIFPYIETGSSANSYSTPPDELISLLSPVTEGVEPASSFTETVDSQLFAQAAQKIAALQNMSSGVDDKPNISDLLTEDELYPPGKAANQLDQKVVEELRQCGQECSFGSGRLTHNLHFRDIYAPKLDRKDNDGVATTKQFGWACVDYIFQSMSWNPSLNKRTEGKLKLVRRLGLYNRSQCKEIGTIPNSEHPSDHFPLVAEFLLRP